MNALVAALKANAAAAVVPQLFIGATERSVSKYVLIKVNTVQNTSRG
jgi:hypothetical protein